MRCTLSLFIACLMILCVGTEAASLCAISEGTTTEAETRAKWWDTYEYRGVSRADVAALSCYKAHWRGETWWYCEQQPGECAAKSAGIDASRQRVEQRPHRSFAPPTWPQYFQDMNGHRYRCDPVIVGGCVRMY